MVWEMLCILAAAITCEEQSTDKSAGVTVKVDSQK